MEMLHSCSHCQGPFQLVQPFILQENTVIIFHAFKTVLHCSHIQSTHEAKAQASVTSGKRGLDKISKLTHKQEQEPFKPKKKIQMLLCWWLKALHLFVPILPWFSKISKLAKEILSLDLASITQLLFLSNDKNTSSCASSRFTIN